MYVEFANCIESVKQQLVEMSYFIFFPLFGVPRYIQMQRKLKNFRHVVDAILGLVCVLNTNRHSFVVRNIRVAHPCLKTILRL